MKNILKYLKYLLIHKYHVGKYCFKYGLYWQGIKHDWSKFLPDEFIAYKRYFYEQYPVRIPKIPIGNVLTQETVNQNFNKAWLKHIHRNKHHWQYWVLRNDDGTTQCLDMPLKYKKEMLADWRGAGIAITGKDNTAIWYESNKNKMQLHDETRMWIENNLIKN